MDTFTEQHLTRWLDSTVLDDERERVERRMRSFIAEYPDLPERMSWPEIRTLAEREL
jgi:hypothetical protein